MIPGHRSQELPSLDSDEDDDADFDYLKTAPMNLHQDRDDDDDDDIVFHGDKNRAFATFASDDWPITPMRDRMVYNKEHSSLDFKDGDKTKMSV